MSSQSVHVSSSTNKSNTTGSSTVYGHGQDLDLAPLSSWSEVNPREAGHYLFGVEILKNIQDEKRPAWRAVPSKEKKEHGFEMFHLKSDTPFRLQLIVLSARPGVDSADVPFHSVTQATIRSLRVVPYNQTLAATNATQNTAWDNSAGGNSPSSSVLSEGPFDLSIIGSEPCPDGVSTLLELDYQELGSQALKNVTASGSVLQMSLHCVYRTQNPGESVTVDHVLYAKVYKKSKMLWSTEPITRVKAGGAVQAVQDQCYRFQGAVWDPRKLTKR